MMDINDIDLKKRLYIELIGSTLVFIFSVYYLLQNLPDPNSAIDQNQREFLITCRNIMMFGPIGFYFIALISIFFDYKRKKGSKE